MNWIIKQPSEELNCSIDFVKLMPVGATLSLISVTAKNLRTGVDSSSTVLFSNPPPSVDGTKIVFRVKDGADGDQHEITVKVQSSGGEKYEEDVGLSVKEQ